MRFRLHHLLSRQTGFSLIEVALVLGITGIVIGGLWILSSNLFYSHSVNQLEKGIVSTASRVRNFYRDRQMKNDKNGNASNITTANFIQLGLIAPEFTTTANTISFSPAFNAQGSVTTTYDLANCVVPNSFALSLVSITKDACNQVVTNLVGTGGQIQANNIVALFVGGNNALTATNNNTGYSYNPATSEASCANGTTVEICFAQ